MLKTYVFPWINTVKKFCIVILRMEIFILFFISMVSAFFPGSYFYLQKFGTLNLLQNMWNFSCQATEIAKDILKVILLYDHMLEDFHSTSWLFVGKKNGVLFNWLGQLILSF